MELRAPTRLRDGKQPDRWERDARGVATARDRAEKEDFDGAEAELTRGKEKETDGRPGFHGSVKGNGISQGANSKELPLGFVNPLFTPRSNGIVIKDNSQLATVKSKVDYEDDLGLDSGGLEDRKRRRAGTELGTTSTDLMISLHGSEENIISMEPKNGGSTGPLSGSRRDQ